MLILYHIIMNIIKLEQDSRPFLTIQSISEILNISEASARVFASRYVQKGIVIRLKKNIYILQNRIDRLSQTELFYLGNIIQTPSYVSLMSALSYYEVTTQIVRNVVESISPIRTVAFDSKQLVFVYTQLQKKLYYGFKREKEFFIATKEKAFLDALYLYSLGRYQFDLESIDMRKLDEKKLKSLLETFPIKTQKIFTNLTK